LAGAKSAMSTSSRGPRRVAFAITGASGIRVGLRAVEAAARIGVEIVGVIITRGAVEVARHEEGLSRDELVAHVEKYAPLYWEDDFTSPLASSSNQPDAMAIVPASMKTVAMIAHGISSNLAVRAALAVLRLGRRLVVAPRETPVGIVELENMLRVARAGAVVVPLCVGYYHKPESVEDITRFLAGKVLDGLGLEEHGLYRRWGERED